MPYLVVEDFRGGLDVRRSPVTAKPGTLRGLTNAFINAGGEVEKRKAFTSYFSAAGTYGLGAFPASPVVFGSAATDSFINPVQATYYQLVGLTTVARINDVEVVNGQLYVVLTRADGVVEHYYNHAKVTTLPTGAASITKILSHKNKVYGVIGSSVYFSGLNTPSDWGATGSGFINLDGQDQGPLDLRSLGVYYNQLALLGRYGTQLWLMDQDPSKNQIINTLGNVGVTAQQAVARVGSGDLLFLHDTGIRSMRARDASNSAIVADTGSPVDDIIRPRLLTENITNTTASLDPIVARVEPLTGQFWLFWRDQIYVLSLVPSTGIAAWSVFTPGFNVDYGEAAGARMTLRGGDQVYRYGGASGADYDTSQAELVTPMLDAGTPATDKRWTAFDAAVVGTWTVEVGTNPSTPDVFETVATVTGATYGFQRIGLSNYGPSMSVRMRCADASLAKVGALVLHYDTAEKG